MHNLQRRPAPCDVRSSAMDEGVFYSADPDSRCLPAVFYRVVPVGTDFFHILELPSGRIKGFRRGHNQACALARALQAAHCGAHD